MNTAHMHGMERGGCGWSGRDQKEGGQRQGRRGIRENEHTKIHESVTMEPGILCTNYKHLKCLLLKGTHFFLNLCLTLSIINEKPHRIKKSQEKGREDWEPVRF